jgi:hypothetical protein
MDLVKKYKLWFAWQDEQCEAWLQRMAARGLHLRAVNVFGFHVFERGEPVDVAYRLDLSGDSFDFAYQRLLRDAGWEYVAVLAGGWHCWRHRIIAGQPTPELFTDKAYKLRKYWRMLVPFALVLAFQLYNARDWQQLASPASWTAVRALSIGMGLLCIYSMVKLGRRIAALR